MLDTAIGIAACFIVLCVTYYNVAKKKKKGCGGGCSGCMYGDSCKHKNDEKDNN